MATTATTVLSVVLLVAGVTLMLVVHILVVFWALRRGLGGSRGASSDEERGEHGCGGGLSSAELGALPCHDYSKQAADGGGEGECAVCLEAFEAGDRCRRLPRCEHSFHAACVDSWLRKSSACPVCRADVVDRPPNGEAKAAAGEMVERTRSPSALEIAAERS